MGDATGVEVRRPSAGDRVERFTLPDPDGRPVEVDPAGSAATVVVFTSSGCPYALAWHDRIQDVSREYRARGVRVVQVVSNDEDAQPADSTEALRQRQESGAFAGELLRDAGQGVARSFGATATPEVFVLDATGVIRYHGAPDADYADPSRNAGWVRESLDAVLDGRAVERAGTPPAGCSLKWRVELLWWAGCPSHDDAYDLLTSVLAEMGRDEVVVRRERIRTRDEAVTRDFPGSPTFQVGGRDLFPIDAAPALGCRVYDTGGRLGPLPAAADLETRLREVLARPWDLPGWTDFRKQQGDR